jgi:hypothetical protein
MTYDDYDRQRKLFHSPVSNLGTVWPLLPPALYQALIDFYSGRSRRPLPSVQDAGDFPMPSGDSSYA